MRVCSECGELVAPGEDHPHPLEDAAPQLLESVPSQSAPSSTVDEPGTTVMVDLGHVQVPVTIHPMGGLLIGRALDSPLSRHLAEWRNVSRRHLTIGIINNRIHVTDTSKNGTWLDGLPLRKGEPANAGISCQLQLARDHHLKVSIVSRRDGAG